MITVFFVWWTACFAGEPPDSVRHIPEVTVEGAPRRDGSLKRLETKTLRLIPNPSGDVEALLKTMPGVASNNELSSQYSVRGGSFDENLVYVNGVEVRRPLLLRSGQQEGLSFVNPDMVASLDFSAGGFGANYGDKMSSALDAQYRTPENFGLQASASLLGASATIENAHGSFSYIAGTRYKTSKYLLKTLETKGDYKPRFFDVQTLLRYRLTSNWQASLFLNLNTNYYLFEPETRTTSFGTLYNSYQVDVYYDGHELDRYNSGFGALSIVNRPNERLKLQVTAVEALSDERESFDIEQAYRLSDLESQKDDSVSSYGVGSELSHARNTLRGRRFELSHNGAFYADRQTLTWGLSFLQDVTHDRLSEWVMLDSAGFAVPQDNDMLQLKTLRRADNSLTVKRAVAWAQYQRRLYGNRSEWHLTAGLRFNWNDMNDEALFSPRVSATVRPLNNNRITGRLAVGLYAQPPTYREIRNINGQINTNVKAQRSMHYLIGGDYQFDVGGKPFKLSSELYYKRLSRLNLYRLENVRLYYAADNLATGYVAGWDVKLNGEFVKDAESWLSLSLMRARADIANDANGSFPLPTDQLFNFNLFFQDYLPLLPAWRVFLNLNFGSKLPYSYPDENRFDKTFRMSPYRRVDIGLSHDFFTNSKNHWLKKMSLYVEVFNLFDTNNTISYFWMQVVNNSNGRSQQYAIPNYLTNRRLNLRISASF